MRDSLDVDSIKDTADLSAEAAVMMKVGRHENVVSLLGICSVNGEKRILRGKALAC